MKLLSIIIFSLFFCKACEAQETDTEFGKSGNGLIYSDATVGQLKFIVDSLNLKFKICELNPYYFSKLQAKAHYFSLETGNVKDAVKDIEANMSFEDFVGKYDKAKVEKDLLVVKFKYKNYEKKDVVEYSSIEINEKYGHSFNFEKGHKNYDQPLKGKWIYEYVEGSLDAFYFLEDFSQHPVPVAYARMIQYADCMVDTSASVFYESASEGGRMYERKVASKADLFVQYVHEVTGKPQYNRKKYNEKDCKIFRKKLEVWDSLRIGKLDSVKLVNTNFSRLLEEAVTEAKVGGSGHNEFEEYVGRYYSKKTALELKRNRIVVGGCSQDQGPRIHALNIAQLAAETTSWEIFLRSHLDIMNDRFDRVSDGSGAWAGRKTYIKELEVLDINVLDLLLGISLRIENAHKNHYYGSIGRLGRALSETQKSAEVETKMLQMIGDNQLDDYNRILIYYLFLNYNYNLEDKRKQAKNNLKLATSVKALPAYLKVRIEESR